MKMPYSITIYNHIHTANTVPWVKYGHNKQQTTLKHLSDTLASHTRCQYLQLLHVTPSLLSPHPLMFRYQKVVFLSFLRLTAWIFAFVILTLLSGQQVESLLESNSLSRVLVVGGETSGMSTLGDLSGLGVLQKSVDTLAVASNSVHEMHFEVLVVWLDGSVEFFMYKKKLSQCAKP